MKPQKGTSLVERHHMMYRSWKSVHRCDRTCDEQTKKENWVFAETTHDMGSKSNFCMVDGLREI